MTHACRYLPTLKRQNLSDDVKYQCSVAKVKEKNVNHQGHSLYIQERCCQVRYNAWKKASKRIDINFPHYCHMLSISNIDDRDHNHYTKVPNSERRVPAFMKREGSVALPQSVLLIYIYKF